MVDATLLTPEKESLSSLDEDGRYEIVNGQRVEMPPLSAYETWIASRLDHRLGPFAETHNLGRSVCEMLFLLAKSPDLQRRPDVAFVSYQRWARRRRVPTTTAWHVVPDLAVEVVSPTEMVKDLLAKVREYFQVSVQLVWVVLPSEHHVYVYESPTRIRVLERSDDLDGAAVIPGFRLPVKTLFEEEAQEDVPETT
jgi:Uma2 family endonuclease